MRFNAEGAVGLVDRKPPGPPSELNQEHREALARIVEAGPIPAIHGEVRWRRTTVQPKNIAFPTDAMLLESAIEQLGKLAGQHDVGLRQSYRRVAKKAAMMAGRYAHAKQFKRMNKEIKFLCSRLGRLIRDVVRKTEDDEVCRVGIIPRRKSTTV